MCAEGEETDDNHEEEKEEEEETVSLLFNSIKWPLSKSPVDEFLLQLQQPPLSSVIIRSTEEEIHTLRKNH